MLTGLRWTAGLRILGQTGTWVITIFVIRLLNPIDYGLMAMATAFIGFFIIINDVLGMNLIQKIDLDDILVRKMFAILIIINVSMFLLFILSAPLISFFLDETRLIPIIRLLSVRFLLFPFTALPNSLKRRAMDFKTLGIVGIVSTLIGSIVTLILAYRGLGVWSLVWGSIAGHLAKTIHFNVIYPCIPFPSFSMEGMGRTISFSSYVMGGAIARYLFNNLDVLLVGRILGKEVLGFYAVGKHLSTLPMEKISGIINFVGFPAYASIQRDKEKASAYFLKTIRVLGFVAFPALWGIASISDSFVQVILGSKWEMAIFPLQMLSLIVPFWMIHNLNSPVMYGLGQPEVIFHNSLIALLFIPTSIAIGSYFGLHGVCIAWLVSFPMLFIVNNLRISSKLGIKIDFIIISIIKPMFFSAIMLYLIWNLNRLLIGFFSPVWLLILLITTGIFVYMAAVWLFGRKEGLEVLNLIKP